MLTEIDDRKGRVLAPGGALLDPFRDLVADPARPGAPDDDADVRSHTYLPTQEFVGATNGTGYHWSHQRYAGGMEQPAVPRGLATLSTWLLGQVAARSHHLVLEAAGGPTGRTFYAVLTCLDERATASQIHISRSTGIDPGDLVSTLRAMEAAKLVRRRPDPDDPRRNLVSLTGRGRAELARLAERLSTAQERLVEPLSAEDRAAFVRCLQELVAHHTELRLPDR